MSRIIRVNPTEIQKCVLGKQLDQFVDLDKMINSMLSHFEFSLEDDKYFLTKEICIRLKYITERMTSYQVYVMCGTLRGILNETLKNIPGMENYAEEMKNSHVPAFPFCFFKPRIKQDALDILLKENTLATLISKHNCWNSMRFIKMFNNPERIESIFLLQKSRKKFLEICTKVLMDNIQIILSLGINNINKNTIIYFSEVDEDHIEFQRILDMIQDEMYLLNISTWYAAQNFIIGSISEKSNLLYDNIHMFSIEDSINSNLTLLSLKGRGF